MMEQPEPYEEFGLLHENASEAGLALDPRPEVQRVFVDVGDGRRLSAIVWGTSPPELVFIHGGAQNAHTWDTVALAMGRPMIAVDLPGHGHSDGPRSSRFALDENAADVSAVIRELAPDAAALIGMSLGGLTTLALCRRAPELVRSVVLVDILPSFDQGSAGLVSSFVDGPASFASFGEILERTILHNPSRTVSSLRRGILHNAVQAEDGSWVWRHARHRQVEGPDGIDRRRAEAAALWSTVAALRVPLMLVRGMRPSSVVRDEDETELLRRLPGARVAHVEEAGHSVQGDAPLALARLIEDFVRPVARPT